ncbi:hypothetical protein Cflav_PD2510 [Pedosphaera parvula Ellin514]|uniref:Uncharacterized protein n=1 Tax=Pedosphaera parvula (strain Ellin514) TaxID=320771 RepID=B9XKM6_PEDPL|nr:hypothetical protein Cflav_PD2510 [Pedosphaera parvula Ellin514]
MLAAGFKIRQEKSKNLTIPNFSGRPTQARYDLAKIHGLNRVEVRKGEQRIELLFRQRLRFVLV